MNHILLTTNESYAQHCAVCMVSLLVNNPNEDFRIVVSGINLSEETKSKLKKSVSTYSNANLTVFDFDEKNLDALPQIGKYSKDIYLRLWVDEYFGDEVEKVLYLDVDIIVVDEIVELFNLNFKDKLLAAVDIPDSECESHARCHLPTEYNYFNSGVLVFNLSKWREGNYLEQVICFLNENKDIALNPDQDALNGLFYRERVTLDYTYNTIGPFFRKGWYEELGNSEVKRIRENVKIVHFNGKGAKPWNYTSNHPYQSKYIEYLSFTAWSNEKLEEKTLVNFLKKKMRHWLGIESFVKMSTLKGNTVQH